MEILIESFSELNWKTFVMFVIGGVLIYLAIKKDYEPMLLLPMGFGTILVNLPLSAVIEYEGVKGVLQIFFEAGIETEIFPILIFVAIGAMTDFSPLLKNPKMIFLGAAAQLGIFSTIIGAILLGNFFPSLAIDLKIAAAIGIIGSADGPTSIFVASKFASDYLGAISVAAYSYMALVPIIQPPIIKGLTTKKERIIRIESSDKKVSKTVLILFPVIVTIVAGMIAPICVPLIGMLMFGNLIRVCGALDKLSKTAQNELANLITLFLGITIGTTLHYEKFLQPTTLIILALGFCAFIFSTAGGIIFVKLLNIFSKNKINPMLGAAGVSAFPMSARVVHKLGLKEDPQNFLLMYGVSANVAGVIASTIAGGLILAIVPIL